ncbi:hypothetical protein MLD38_037446 [Melastoma candidum]|uniref:Uncharacterized protein n=1 Tax=Melastoma candidum TaxID=119954 RepID=A0ACB9LN23_9MYRT|nr:hypothetical protein MLD38_037446 [Melastoma candidum]
MTRGESSDVVKVGVCSLPVRTGVEKKPLDRFLREPSNGELPWNPPGLVDCGGDERRRVEERRGSRDGRNGSGNSDLPASLRKEQVKGGASTLIRSAAAPALRSKAIIARETIMVEACDGVTHCWPSSLCVALGKSLLPHLPRVRRRSLG